MRRILLVSALVFIAGVSVFLYQYHKPHKDIAKSEAEAEMTAEELFRIFSEDEAAANAAYLDKVIRVKGTVREVSRDEKGQASVILSAGDMFGVICQLDELTEHPRTDFEPGETVTFKGVCTGMLMDVVLVRCVEVR